MSVHRVYTGDNPYEIVLSMLEEARATIREYDLTEYQAQEIQIRLNELGMTVRSNIDPKKSLRRIVGFKETI